MIVTHKNHRSLSKVILFSVLLGIGFSAGIGQKVSDANASTSNELEHQENMSKSTIPTNSQTDSEFNTQITDPVDVTQPIKDIFPDAVLANSVANSLGVSVEDKLTDSKSYNDKTVYLSVDPLNDSLTNPYLVKDWTGMSALKDRLYGIIFPDQGDNFDNKALTLTKNFLSSDAKENHSIYLNFSGDGITQTTFDSLMNYVYDNKIAVDGLQLNANYIHDFELLDKVKFTSGDQVADNGKAYSGFYASNQFGAKHVPTVLTVKKDGTIDISNQQLISLSNMPSQPISYTGIFYQDMFDTDDTRSVYKKGANSEETIQFEPNLDFENKEQIINYINMMVSNEKNITDHVWSRLGHFNSDGNLTYLDNGITEENLSSQLDNVNSSFGMDIKPSDITAKFNESGVIVSNVPKDASSITIRNDYTDNYSQAAGYGNTIDVSVSHESDSSSGGNSDSSKPSTKPSEADNISSNDEPDKTADGKTAVKKGQAVYAIKQVKLHKSATFSKNSTKITYQKQPRTQRPQFVVTGYAHSKSGLLRYKVRDVNHTQKTDGQTGYLTSNTKYVVNTYYKANPKKIRVINQHGINAYRTIKLNGKVIKHYRKGTTVKIKRIKSHNLTTRLQLSNGTWITANKTLVKIK